MCTPSMPGVSGGGGPQTNARLGWLRSGPTIAARSAAVELRQLRYFEAVARHASFTRAAEELHVVQSALSQQVRRLEQELGVELMERTSRSVRLTSAGEAVLVRARRVLEEADALRAEVDGL